MGSYCVFYIFNMTQRSSFYAAAFAFTMLFGSPGVQANPSNEDEASLGAAAMVVLAHKCSPGQVGQFESAAHNHLAYMVQRFTAPARARIFEDLRIKTRALQISSSGDSCTSALRLHSMAKQWGYGHILQSMGFAPR